ncbi:MAG TPA: SusC/RagA family TonB-linked outer membrane protein [Chitinophagaceae bacterium]|nr:SusC/RagA family TonB-linked outer membrane protein [Chitinophagaceae bacterium]
MIPKRLLARIVLPAILMIVAQTVLAQKTITGKVTDSKDGSPIVGASVRPKGGTGGTSTANDGTYRLTVADNVNALLISYVGYAEIEVSISGKTTADVSLVSGGSNMNEIVVIGYQAVRKKDVTGSAVTISSKDFNQGVTTSPQQLIQGKVPGLEVTNTNGMPGAATTIRIRGNSTIRSGNNPLYVVDGIPLDGRIARPDVGVADLGSTPAADPLYFFNSNDINTISILKDASESAIYGSRAANGVVLIETKRAASGATRLDVNANVGFSNIMKKYEVLSAGEYRAELKARGVTGGDYGSDVDPLGAILRTGIVQNYNVAMSGGTDDAKYRASFGYFDQEGIVKNSSLKRYSAMLNGAYKFLPSKKLSLGFMVLAAHNTETGAPVSNNAGASGNLISAALQWNPTLSFTRANGTLWNVDNPTGATQPNPLSILGQYHDQANVNNILAFLSGGYKFTDWLEYNFKMSVNHQDGERNIYVSDSAVFTTIRGKGVSYSPTRVLNTQVYQHTLTFNKPMTEALSINAILGYEYQVFKWRGKGIFATGFSTTTIVPYTDIYQNVAAGNTGLSAFNDPTSYLQSYFGRVRATFKDKYIFMATLRSDGSSKFGSNNKYGYFPSFAARWNILQEDFMQGSTLFDGLSLRAGWGVTGNQEFPAGASQTQYSYTQGSIAQANVANPDLQWEETKQWNIGLDWSILNGRLSGAFDYFNKKTENLLFNFDAIQPAPATKYWINLPGSIENRGFEFIITAQLVQNSRLNWNLSINGAALKNTVLDYNGPTVLTGGLNAQGSSGARVQRIASDQPVNAFYTRRFTGFDANGFATYANDGSPEFVGSPNPTFIGGLSSSAIFGKWSLGVNFSGAFGHLIYNETLNGVLNIGNLGKWNIDKNLVGSKESLANPITSSSRFLEKGDYVKFGNATLSYNVGNVGNTIKNLRLSVVGQNLFYITKFSGFSPEVNTDKAVDGVLSYGMEYIPYPTARTIQFGLNFSL